MGVKIVTEPAAEPVTTAEAKSWMGVTSSTDDMLISILITGARRVAEAYTGRALITQVWDYTANEPTDPVTLPKPPLQGATPYVTGTDDVEAAEATTVYEVVSRREPGRVILKAGQVWSISRQYDGFRVRYTAGYGTSSASVPQGIRDAIMEIVSYLYDNRGGACEPVTATTLRGTVPIAALLLDPYRTAGAFLG